MSYIAARLARVQRSRNLSVAQLAQKSKVEEPELESILRGEKDLEIVTVFRIAAGLEVPPATLLRGIRWIPDEDGGGRFEFDEGDSG
jgi:transcriptional regulator with XRE-family HTH domain